MIKLVTAGSSRDGPLRQDQRGSGALDAGREQAAGPPGTLEAVVLLKNRNNLLPLDKSRLKSIAVSASAQRCRLGLV